MTTSILRISAFYRRQRRGNRPGREDRAAAQEIMRIKALGGLLSGTTSSLGII